MDGVQLLVEEAVAASSSSSSSSSSYIPDDAPSMGDAEEEVAREESCTNSHVSCAANATKCFMVNLWPMIGCANYGIGQPIS